MSIRNCTRRTTGVAFLVWISFLSSARGQEMDIEHVVSVLAAFEGDVQVVEYDVETTVGEFASDSPPFEVASMSDVKSNAVVRYDSRQSRYLVRLSSVQKALTLDKKGEQIPGHLASYSEFSNDLETFRTWYRGQMGKTIPEADAPRTEATFEGILSSSDEEKSHQQGVGFFNIRARQIGLCWMPPFFWSTVEDTQPLSVWIDGKIKGGESLTARKLSDDNVLLTVRNEKTTSSSFDLELTLDLSKGCLISAEWKQVYHLTDGLSPTFKKLYVTNAPVENRWLPQECVLVNTRGELKRFDKWTYSNVRLNPEVKDEDFRVTFPTGITLTDHVEQKYYVTGAGASDDSAAVQAFMSRYNLEPPAPGESPNPNRRTLFLLGAGMLGVVLVGIVVWRRKGKSQTAGLVALVLASVVSNAGSCADIRPDGTWITSAIKESDVPIRQCGFVSTCFLFHYFGVDFDAGGISRALRPTENGISLSDISNVLNAYGLETVPKKNVSVKALGRSVKRNCLAIVPVTLEKGQGHYLICMFDQKANQPVVVDVLSGVVPLSSSLKAEHLKLTEGVVLFVSQPAAGTRRPPNSEQVVLGPDRHDLGTFFTVPIEGEKLKPLAAEFNLKNTGESPVLVTSVQSNCGCLLPGWSGGVILPGEQQRLQVDVLPQSWGRGTQQKPIVIVFADRTTKQARISGHGQVQATASRLTLSENVAVIDGSAFLAESAPTSRLERRFVVRGPVETLADTTVETSESWCSSHLEPTDVGEAQLVVVLKPLPELMKQLRSSTRTAIADVVLTENHAPEGVLLQVKVTRPVFLRADKLQVALGKSSDQTITNEFVGFGEAFAADSIVVKEIKTSPAGLIIARDANSLAKVNIRMDPSVESNASQFVVTCSAVSGNPQIEDLVRFVVRIEK